MPLTTPSGSAVVDVQGALIDVLPVGVPSLALAAAIGGWLDAVEMEPGAAERLAAELRRLRPID